MTPLPLTSSDQMRLARIRADMAQWEAMNPEASEWDVPFLLRVLDRLVKK